MDQSQHGAEDAVNFLLRWPTRYLVLTAIDPDTGSTETRTFTKDQRDELAVWIEARNGKRNIYFSPNEVRGPLAKKAKKAHMAAAVCFYVDIDPDKKIDPKDEAAWQAEQERIYAKVMAFSPAPSIVIFSGGGFQCYWLLREASPLGGPDDIERYERFNRRLESELGGDHCFNVDRIMRAPFTENLPNQKKQKAGRKPTMSGTTEILDWELLYSVHDFVPLKGNDKTKAAPPKPKSSSNGPLREPPEWVTRLIQNGPDAQGKHSYKQDRSGAVLAVVLLLVRCGWSDEEILATILDRDNRISDHIYEQNGRTPQEYAQRQVDRARKKVAADPWRERMRDGTPKASLHNARVAITALGIACSYDTFHNKLLLSGEMLAGEVSDNVIMQLRQVMSERFGFDLEDRHTRDGVKSLALERCFDPVCDMLDKAQAEWDGVERLDRMAVDTFNAEDTPLNRAMMRKWMVGAVRRARAPGCKFDTIPVLESAEGWNKSTALRILAGDENFSDQSILGKAGKEVQEQLSEVWIHENADLAGMNKAEVEQVKAFASRQVDAARPAYGHFLKKQPRHSVEIATTNSDEYLQSQTGNRRFWPLRVRKTIDLDKLRRDRLQLWGEAAHYEAAGESLTLDESLWPNAGEEQEKRRVKDPWEDIVRDLPSEVPSGWHEDGRARPPVRIVWREDRFERVASADLLKYVLRIPIERQTREHAMRLATVMKLAGWDRNDGKKITINKQQVRGYQRQMRDLI